MSLRDRVVEQENVACCAKTLLRPRMSKKHQGHPSYQCSAASKRNFRMLDVSIAGLENRIGPSTTLAYHGGANCPQNNNGGPASAYLRYYSFSPLELRRALSANLDSSVEEGSKL